MIRAHSFWRRWRRHPAGLRRNERGVAMTEFALSLPILLGLLLYGLEVANYALAHMKVSRLASLTADNAARYQSSIDEADVRKLMLGAKLASEGIEFEEHGRLILSSVTQNAKQNGHWIRWQRCDGDLSVSSAYGAQDKGKNDTSLKTLDGMIVAPSSNVMFAEAVYDYQPLFSERLLGPQRIRHQASFMARQLSLFSITNLNKEQPLTC